MIAHGSILYAGTDSTHHPASLREGPANCIGDDLGMEVYRAQDPYNKGYDQWEQPTEIDKTFRPLL
jgi:hypothetical protein